MLLAYHKVYARYGKHNGKKQYCRGGSKGRIAAAVAVKHIVYIADYRVHASGVKIRAEKGHGVAVCLERTYKTGYYQIEYHWGYHGQRYAREHSRARRAVYTGGV